MATQRSPSSVLGRVARGAAVTCVAALIAARVGDAQDTWIPPGAGPIIFDAYPPPRDLRSPDRTMHVAARGPVTIAYNANGCYLATAADDFVIRVWDVRTGEDGTGNLVRTFVGHAARVLAIAPGPPAADAAAPANTLVSVSADRTVMVWDESTGGGLLRKTLATADDDRTAAFEHAALRPGQTPHVVTAAGDDLRLWNYHTGDLVWRRDTRGEQLAAAGGDGKVNIWYTGPASRTSSGWLCTLTGHTGAVLAVVFSPNGQKMATAGIDGTARTWTVPLPPVSGAALERIAAAAPPQATVTPTRPRKILVFWRADAILHTSGVPAANHAIEVMGKRTGTYDADFSRDVAVFDPAVLARYDAIVMNSTAHLVLPDAAKQAYLDYVRRGGGLVGIHAAIDMFRDWPAGAQVIGATCGDHPWGPEGTWRVALDEPDHPLLRAWGGRGFTINDEFCVMGEPYTRADRRVLLHADLSDAATRSVNLSRRTDQNFALSWIKRYGAGRVFYCDFGHSGESFQRRDVLQYYLDGIQYALGDLQTDDAPRP